MTTRRHANDVAERRQRPATRPRYGSILIGLVLVAAYLALFTYHGFRAEMGRGFVYVGWKEAFFWLAHFTLATPGLLLLGFGLAPLMARHWPAWRRRYETLADAAWRGLAAAFATVLFVLAIWGSQDLLLGVPLTDDEHTVRFGAQMIAAGQVQVALPLREAFYLPFVYERAGRVSSFDYPGGLLFAAASLASGAGAALYALLVAASGLAVAVTAAHIGGRAAGLVVALLWLTSPMISSLSYTSHPQLLSRSFIALAFAAYIRLIDSAAPRRALTATLLGAAAAAAFLTRPIEATCLLAPLAMHFSYAAASQRRWRGPWLAAALTWLAGATAFALYNTQITGAWYLQARFTPQLAGSLATELGPRQLLGVNLGFNLMMLAVWFLGPLGLPVAAVGLGRRSWLVRVLASGIGLQLFLALLHHDTGIHAVGPIHYSEIAVPLLLLVALAIEPLTAACDRLRIGRHTLAAIACAYVVSLAGFDAVYALSLREQARNQHAPLAAVERADIGRAVVIAAPFYELWELRPEMNEVRAWAMLPPRPDPFLDDPVLWIRPGTDLAAVAARFPDRALYRAEYRADGEPVVLQRLSSAAGDVRERPR